MLIREDPQVAIVPAPTLPNIRTVQCATLDVLIRIRGVSVASATRHLTWPTGALEKMMKVALVVGRTAFAREGDDARA